MSKPLIEISNLTVSTTDDNRTLVNDVSFSIAPGEAVGVVGESGSGKTLTALSLLGLLPRGVHATSGSITYAGKDLLHTDGETLRSIRGNEIAMIYQDPMTALNPVMKLGAQLIEVIQSHGGDTSDATDRVLEAFTEVGIPDPKRAYESYPHEFSGGMRQRVMIAMALILSPEL